MQLALQPKEEEERKPIVATRAPVDQSTGCELCQILLPAAQRRAAHEQSANHQRRLRFGIYQKQIASSEQSKRGVSLGPAVSFGIVDYSLDAKGDDDGIYTAILTCHNTNTQTVRITTIEDMRSKHKAYSQPFTFVGTNTSIPARGKFNIVVCFGLQDRSAVGIYETRIRVHFQKGSEASFAISRSVRAVVGNKEEMESLKPTSPYVPKARPAPESFVPKKDVIEGEKPPALSEIAWINPLPRFEIPTKISTEIARYADETFKEQIKGLRKLIPAGWDSISYRQKFQNLLWLEEERQARDVRQYDIENAQLRRTADGKYFTLEVLGLSENRPSVIVGDSILVKARDDKRWWSGYVHQVMQKEVLLKFNKGFNPIKGIIVDVQFTVSRLPLRRMHAALDSNLKLSLITPFESQGQSAQRPTDSQARLSFFNRRLEGNVPQQIAVAGILYKSSAIPTIVYGPPGTGKTMVAVEAIRQILKAQPKAKILVSCPSNAACDVVTQRLDMNKSELFRLNAPSRTKSKDIPPKVLENTFIGEHGTFAVYPLEKIKSFRVIVCTCISASVLHGIGLAAGHFSHIFVDEAGQALESEVMIPLQYSTEQTKEVLCGDPKQLGPIVRSDLAKAYGLDRSYLSRLMDNPAYSESSRSKTYFKLTQNYRSHPAILTFPSQTFYKDELVPCADAVVTHSLLGWEGFASKPQCPILFHSVIGEDAREARSPSFFNAAEASQVKVYVEQLCGDMKMRGEDVGIISPYNAQVGKIRQLLQKSKTLGQKKEVIRVGSVELFQGQERRAIVISTVRSSAEHVENDIRHALGFLALPQRFNVAITRAQAALIIVGNPNVLGKDKLWRQFLCYVHTHGNWRGTRPTEWNVSDGSVNDSLEEMIGSLKLEDEVEDLEDREWIRLEA